MDAVYKYKLSMDDEADVEMPKGARILHIAWQDAGHQDVLRRPAGSIQIWAMVDSDAEMEIRRFNVRGTGHPCVGIHADDYISTVFVRDLVFHIFENKGEARQV